MKTKLLLRFVKLIENINRFCYDQPDRYSGSCNIQHMYVQALRVCIYVRLSTLIPIRQQNYFDNIGKSMRQKRIYTLIQWTKQMYVMIGLSLFGNGFFVLEW